MELGKGGHPDVVIGQDFFGERLVPGDQQAGRRRPGVAVAVHVQEGRDGVLVTRVAAKSFAAIEDELRLEGRQLLEHRPEVLADADQMDVVVTRNERPRDVVLGLLDLLRDLPLELGVSPFGMRRIEDHRDLHASTRCISRPTVDSATRMTSPPTTPTAGSSSIAVRKLPVRSDKYPINGGASASPARCENNTNAPSTEA